MHTQCKFIKHDQNSLNKLSAPKENSKILLNLESHVENSRLLEFSIGAKRLFKIREPKSASTSWGWPQFGRKFTLQGWPQKLRRDAL